MSSGEEEAPPEEGTCLLSAGEIGVGSSEVDPDAEFPDIEIRGVVEVVEGSLAELVARGGGNNTLEPVGQNAGCGPASLTSEGTDVVRASGRLSGLAGTDAEWAFASAAL